MLRFWSGAVLRLVAVMLMASFAGAMLMRIAPGFSSDDQELNSGLSAQSIQAIRRAHLADANIPHFYAQYLAALMRGDLGTSRSLNQPVKELLRERLPTTLMNLAFALAVGWLLGLALAIAAQIWDIPSAELSCQWTERNFYFHSRGCVGAGLFAVAMASGLCGCSAGVPQDLSLHAKSAATEQRDAARAYGARKRRGPWRVLAWHVAPIAFPQIIALVGVSISIGIGVLLPIEVVSDVAGIGQLAWQAAQARDLPLLVNLTMVVTFVTVCATLISDAAQRGFKRSAA